MNIEKEEKDQGVKIGYTGQTYSTAIVEDLPALQVLPFILIPNVALSIDLGRYRYTRAEVAKAADAAALAAAAEISQRVFEETGDLQSTSKTWANAQAFASMNNGYPAQYGVHAVVTGITVDAGDDTVLVQVSANLERLFPSVVPEVVVTEEGLAEIRAFTR